jgi:hypothetical protein
MTCKTMLFLSATFALSSLTGHDASAQSPMPGATKSPRGRPVAPDRGNNFGMEAEQRRLNAEISFVNNQQNQLNQRKASLDSMKAQLAAERQQLLSIADAILRSKDNEALERVKSRVRSFEIAHDRYNGMMKSLNQDVASWKSRGQRLDQDIAAFKAKYDRSSGSNSSGGFGFNENAPKSSRSR